MKEQDATLVRLDVIQSDPVADKILELWKNLLDNMALGMKHAANSTAALRFPETRLDAVRIGSAFLGRLSVPNEWGFQLSLIHI